MVITTSKESKLSFLITETTEKGQGVRRGSGGVSHSFDKVSLQRVDVVFHTFVQDLRLRRPGQGAGVMGRSTSVPVDVTVF